MTRRFVFRDVVREALSRLYDPPGLATTPLAAELRAVGGPRSTDDLYELLLGAIDQMRPPDRTPRQAQGWRRYRYLQLRYIDCATHESAAHALEISLRQATRIHQEALQVLGALLLSNGVPAGPSVRPGGSAVVAAMSPVPAPTLPDKTWETELEMVGRQPPEGPVDLHDVVASACDTLARIASDQEIRFQIEVTKGLRLVSVNRVCLRQIVLNLLLSHIQSARGGTIRVCGNQSASNVAIVFHFDVANPDPLYGTSVPANGPLLGAAKYLARLQGAKIEEIEERQARRALCLCLPVDRTRAVLVVDDNPDVGDLFRRMLGGSPYWPTHVRTVTRALHLIHECPPDVIVLDVVMPARDGWEILAMLKNDPRTASIPVVVCSVLPDKKLALSLGAADFLPKPVTQAGLLGVFDHLWS